MVETPQTRSPFSRRGLLRTSAVGAAAGVAAVGVGLPASARGAARTGVAVTATVVRASHSSGAESTIRFGVRTSVRANGEIEDGQVVILDGIDFFASQDEIREAIIGQVRIQVSERFRKRGMVIRPEDITVRVFGGLW